MMESYRRNSVCIRSEQKHYDVFNEITIQSLYLIICIIVINCFSVYKSRKKNLKNNKRLYFREIIIVMIGGYKLGRVGCTLMVIHWIMCIACVENNLFILNSPFQLKFQNEIFLFKTPDIFNLFYPNVGNLLYLLR